MTEEVERHPVFQGLMWQAYARYQGNNLMAHEYTPSEPKNFWGQDAFWDQLDQRERFAVSLGNLNYQVGNGGFMQWSVAGNGYGTARVMRFCREALNRVGTPATAKAFAILHEFAQLRLNDRMSERAHDNAVRRCEPLDTRWYDIDDDVLDDCEAYLAKGGC